MKLKSVSANNYINFFTDAKARAGIDGFLTVNYGDYADPAALLATVVLPGRLAELRQLQQPEDDLVARVRTRDSRPGQAGRLVARPRSSPPSAAALDPGRSAHQHPVDAQEAHRRGGSFAYMFAPWADHLGGTG